MNKHTTLFLSLFLSCIGLVFISFSPNIPKEDVSLKGAWALKSMSGETTESLNLQMVKILTDDHFMFAFYNESTQQFFSAGGGRYIYKDGTYTEIIDFHTSDPKLVGRSLSFDCKVVDATWHHTGTINGGKLDEQLVRLDDGSDAALVGLWELEQHENEKGKMSKAKKNVKRMKILSGNHFQWVEFHTKSGKFFLAGGGTYSTEGNIYREKLTFFSPDSTWVGKTVEFEFSQDADKWNIKEYQVTRGDRPINEVWAKRE